jgi:predicted phosphodiesterase
MKRSRKQYRQGDILLVPTNVPRKAKAVYRENGRLVLAHGEVTGHAHAILETSAELVTQEQADDLYLLVHGSEHVDLVHEEHGTISVDPGAYKVVRQREYAPEETRLVAD